MLTIMKLYTRNHPRYSCRPERGSVIDLELLVGLTDDRS